LRRSRSSGRAGYDAHQLVIARRDGSNRPFSANVSPVTPTPLRRVVEQMTGIDA